MQARILIVDDDPNITASLVERLEAQGFEIQTAASGQEALEKAREVPDLILLDLQMPKGDGFFVLKGLERSGIESTVIVITAHGSIQKAVEAMRLGAYDFIEKPFDVALINESIKRGLEHARLKRQKEALEDAMPRSGFIASDPCMQPVIDLAKKAARSAATILIFGESGVGKEVLAQQIHAWSPRSDGPFLALNCAALSESLLESELFGHERGAFTGAHARKKGKIELAHRGTLFLDEIGDISAAFQAKLLRVLQERSFERVGGSESIQVDVRVLAATNKDLTALVKDGAFREDLFYRLNVISILLPPLRDRSRDIRGLCEHFALQFARDAKKSGLTISPEAMAVLAGHAWPGNIRELKNAIERAVVLCDGDEVLVEDLPPDLVAASEDAPGDDFHSRVEAYRKCVLQEALTAMDGNRTKAAQALGLQRTYFMRLIKKHGL